MPAYRLSPSSLGLLDDCPRCFWLQMVKGVKRPDAIFPSLPSGIDSVLKAHFDSYRKRGELPPELVSHKITAKLFADTALLDVWRNNFKGIQWTDRESGMTLRGAVDELLDQDGTLIVLDFKTRGFPLKEDTAEYYRDQIDLYNFLLGKNGYKTADYAYLLFFHPVGMNGHSSFLFKTDIVKMDVDVKHAEQLFKNAVKVLSGQAPEPSKGCGYCKWARGYS